MKYLILFATLIAQNIALCAGTTNVTTDETNLNKTLRDNAANSQPAESSTPTRINILSTNRGSSTTTTTGNLTDQEKQLSENYVDQVTGNKIIKEKCVGEMAQACSGSEVDRKVIGMSPGMIKAAAAAYASFGAMSDGILQLSPKAKAPAASSGAQGGTPPDAKEEKPTDYCKYIPAATEAIATFSQKNTVSQLNNGGDTSQKEALLKAAKSHDGRADQAQIQAVGWYGGAACYVGVATFGNVAWDTSLWVKLGAATLLGTFYQSEVSANKDYAKKTREIADTLPSKGDCNPVTQNDCYCSQAEHENDKVYCKAQIAERAASTTFSKTACVDNRMQIDSSCSCEKTSTCFDKYIENQGSALMQMGFGSSNSPFKAITSLARGKLEAGSLNSQSYAGTAAIAKKALNEMSGKIPGNNNPLTLSQKEMADAIVSKGIPASVARLMAQNAPTQGAIDKAMAKFDGLGSYQMASYSNPSAKNNVLDFSGGNGLGIRGNKGDKKGSSVDDFLGKLNPKSGNNSNAKVLEFAQKAQAMAPQITKSDRPIFEIISIRYQTSGRRLLQIEPSN